MRRQPVVLRSIELEPVENRRPSVGAFLVGLALGAGAVAAAGVLLLVLR